MCPLFGWNSWGQCYRRYSPHPHPHPHPHPRPHLEGSCEGRCDTLAVYITGYIVANFFTNVNNVPAIIVIIKSVDDQDTASALALTQVKPEQPEFPNPKPQFKTRTKTNWNPNPQPTQMLVRLVSNIPAPIIFGYILDAVCAYDDGENCLLYDASILRYVFFACASGGKALSAISLLVAIIFYMHRYE
jgi:hypothetical protein